MINIGIQGNKGSFSEEAALSFVERQHIKYFHLDYLITSETVLSAVEKNAVNYGILAIENAQGGVVLESITALAHHRCQIVDMFSIFVNQHLMTLPGVHKEEITAIHSHRQAIRQCRQYLAEHFWGCALVEEKDTAEAARMLAAGDLPRNAAIISNRNCAAIYGLEIWQENIHDLKNNLTLFMAVTIFEKKNEFDS